MKAIPSAIIRYRWLVLIIPCILGAVTIPGVFQLALGVTMEDYFLEDDPVLKNQERFNRLFPENRFVGVLIQTEDVFSRTSLELMKELGERLLREVPYASRVRSLVHSELPPALNTELEFRNNTLISTEAERADFKRGCNKNLVIKGVLFSKDNREAWVQVQLSDFSSPETEKDERDPQFAVGKTVYEIVRSLERPSDIRLTAAGVPVFAFRKERETMQDMIRVLIFASIAALLLSIIIMRNWKGVAGTVLVILLSSAGVLGVQGLLGITVDSAFISVPIILVIGVSIGYTVHILKFYKIEYNRSGNSGSASIYALSETIKPIFFTALTTIAGLLSFLLVEIKPIRWIGLTSAVSIFLVFILTLTLFPALISFGKPMYRSRSEKNKRGLFKKGLFRRRLFKRGLFKKGLSMNCFPRVARFVTERGRVLLVLFAGIVAITIPGVTRVTVDFNAEDMMGLRLPHMKDQVRIGASSIASGETMDLVISIPKKGFLNPKQLLQLTRLEEEIRELPLVQGTTSLAGIVRDMNYTLHRRQEEFRRLPKKRSHVRYIINALKSTDPRLFNSWVDNDLGTTRVFIELSEFSSLTIKENIAEIEDASAALFTGKKDVFFGGPTYQMAVMNQYVTKGLIRSLITAFIMITLIMMLLFRSVRTGLIAMVPNLFPVLLIGGIMGYFNVSLEFVTMTVAPMIMGLAVDDTIHFLSHLRDEYGRSDNFRESVGKTFTLVGSAITETTVILCLTFSLFFISDITSIRTMGLLVCIGLIAAYLADLFITPVLLGKLMRVKSKV